MDRNDQPTTPWSENERTQGYDIPHGSPVPPMQHFQSISRRKLFGFTALGLAGAGIASAGTTIALQPLWRNGTLNALLHGPAASQAQMGHLLRRAGFGATLEELNTYASYGFNGAVERLINYQQVSDDMTENRLKTLQLDLNKPVDQQQWWLLRMAWTQRPLLEKMTLFWHGVLTSSYRKVGGAASYKRMIVQNQFLRNHAFDTLDTILLGITSDPAMLFYLDLTKSKKNHPNENYARELMELFTLGVGNYEQTDVYQAAAALTGWHVKRAETEAYYQPSDHVNTTKTFLGHTGNLDYKDVIGILTNHPKTPWFICRKLFTFFVYENPSTDDLKPLVDTYVKSGHNMGEVMRTLLLSPQFSSPKAYRSRLKSPTEYVVGAYRALGIQGNGRGLPYMTTVMGQTLFDPPNVAGWPGDKNSALWLNSGTWMARLNYIDLLLIGSRNQRTGVYQPLNLQKIIDMNNIDSPERFVDYFSSFLLDGVLEKERRTQFIDYFSQQDTAGRGENIHLANGKSYPLHRVRGTLYLMLASPEYHLN